MLKNILLNPLTIYGMPSIMVINRVENKPMDRQAVIAQNLRSAIPVAPKLDESEIDTLQKLLHKLEQSGDVNGLTQLIIQATGAIQRISNG